MRKSKQLIAAMMAVSLVGTTAAQHAQVNYVFADEANSVTFILSDAEKDNEVSTENAVLTIYLDAEYTTEFEGSAQLVEGSIIFAADEEFDIDKTYYYVLNIPDYKEVSGEFSGSESMIAVVVESKYKKINLSAPDVSISIKEGSVDLSDYVSVDEEYEGTLVFSKKSMDDMATLDESTLTLNKVGEVVVHVIALADGDYQTEEVDLTITITTPVFDENNVLLSIGGDDIDLRDALSIEEDYDGEITCTVTDGADVLSIADTALHAVALGEATVHVKAAASEYYEETEADITVTVSESSFLANDAEVSYGNEIDLSDYVSVDPAYTGTLQYTVKTGEDTITISDSKISTIKVGTATVTVTAPADNNFLAQTKTITVTVAAPEIAVTPIEVTYGDSSYDADLSVSSSVTGFTYTITDGSDVISIDGSMITALKAGSATVQVSAEIPGMESPLTESIAVTVAKKDLGTLTNENIQIEAVERIYDTTSITPVNGTIDAELFLDGDTGAFTANAKTTSANVGSYNASLGDFVFESEKYTADFSGITKTVGVTIQAIDIVIIPNDLTLEYNTSDWRSLRRQRYTISDVLNAVEIQTDADTSYKQEYESVIKNAVTVSIDYTNLSDSGYAVGEYGNAIVVTIDSSKMGNFNITNESSAKIIIEQEVTQDQALWNRTKIAEKSDGVYVADNGTIYLAPGAHVDLTVIDEETTYNTVAVKLGNSSYSSRIIGADESGTPTGSFYLYDSENPSTRTDSNSRQRGAQDNTLPTGIIRYDADAPEIALDTDVAYELQDETESDVVFDTIVKEGAIDITATFEDAGSGIKTAEYAILSVDAENENTDTLISRFDSAEKIAWGEENSISILEDSEDGYYVIIVHAVDQVGNERYMFAGGVVVDSSAADASVDGITDGAFYSDDTDYTIVVADADTITSGIESVVVTVEANGEEITGSKDGNTYINSFELSKEEIQELLELEGEYNLSQIQKAKEELTLSGRLSKDINANNVLITVTIVDYAGNETTMTRTVNIDSDAPVVTVSYDNNNAENGSYFNASRTATISIDERNYVESNTVFDITVDGVQGSYSVTDVQNGTVPGVILTGQGIAGTISTYTIQFGTSDHAFVWGVHVEDRAGNTTENCTFADGTVAGEGFVIDTVSPSASLTMSNENGSMVVGSGNRQYTNTNVTVTLHVSDKNLNPSRSSYTLVQTDGNGNAVASYDLSNLATMQNDASWTKNGDSYTLTFQDFTGDANYDIGFVLVDQAGNQTQLSNEAFTVDKTAPTGSVTVSTPEDGSASNALSENTQFNLYTNVQATVEQTSSDATSGLQSVSYWLYTPDANAKGTFAVPGAAALLQANWQPWTGALTLNSEQQTVIYIRLIDKAGNITYLNASSGLIVDKTSPEAPQITITAGDSSAIFAGDVPFQIGVTDPVSGGTYAGLKSVSYEVLNNGVVTQSGNYDAALSDKTARTQSITRTETVDASLNNSNHVTIRVTATDYAGNTTSAETTLKIDVTAPRIEVAYDTSTINNQYNTSRTATVTVYERNFDPSGFASTIASVLGNNAQISNWILAENMGESDDAVSTLTIVYADDDDYTFTASVKDLAGNETSLGRTDTFTIDKTAPVITIAFDNNNATNGRYFSTTRTATIAVNDRYFDLNSLGLEILAGLNNMGITSPMLSAWTTIGDISTATLVFDADGDYSFAVNAKDLAGNDAEAAVSGLFTIDQTKPAITITGLEDEYAYNSEISPEILFTDNNLGTTLNATITLTGARHETETLTGTIEDVERGWKVLLEDIEKSRDTDDVYTLLVSITDLAGNVETKEMTFSINRYGSNFTFDDPTTEVIETFYHRDGQDLVVYETNVNELTHKSITVGVNGVSTLLTEGKDYTVKEETTDGWKVYTYTISADVFTEEGIYEIVITSTDAAGNTQDNQLKEAPITLAIDHTSPTIVVRGIEDGKSYNATTQTVSFDISDNIAAGRLVIYLNGELFGEYDGKYLYENGNTVTIDIPEQTTYQSIYAIGYDAAGNQVQTETMRVLITSNALTRFYYNKPAFFGSIGGLGALIAAFFILLGKKKKKEEEEDKIPTEELDERPKGNEPTGDVIDK